MNFTTEFKVDDEFLPKVFNQVRNLSIIPWLDMVNVEERGPYWVAMRDKNDKKKEFTLTLNLDILKLGIERLLRFEDEEGYDSRDLKRELLTALLYSDADILGDETLDAVVQLALFGEVRYV